MPTYKIGLEDGRSLNIDADSQEAALAGAQHFITNDAAPAPSGVVAGFEHGLSGVAKGMESTLHVATGTPDGPKEPDNYKAAPIIREGGHWYNPMDYQLSNIPQNVAEMVPSIAQDVAAAKTGASLGSRIAGPRGAAVGGAIGALGSRALRTFGPGAHENAAARTGDEDAPVTGADVAREGVKQAVAAPLSLIGINRLVPGLSGKAVGVGAEGAGNALKKYLATVGTEAVTGGANDVVNQIGTTIGTDKGIQYDPNKTAEAAITSGATGGALVAPRTAADLTSAVKFRKFGGDNAEAASALANRQLAAAAGKKITPDAVDAAHADVHNELSAAAKNEDSLSTDNANTLKRIQSGGTANSKELSALETEASPETTSLARQALLSSKIKDMGVGGISGAMDKLGPIARPVTYIAGAALGSGIPVIGHLTLPALGGVYGAYGAARAFDGLTGARVPAQGFVNKFADANVPIRAPQAVPATPAPVSTSVPQVAPPQNTALWGNPTPEPPSLRSTLNTNVKLEEGMAKMAAQIAAEKKKAMIASAMPALQQLAATTKPVTADEPAPAPAPINPLMLPRDITGPAKNLTGGMKKVSRAQEVYNIATRKAEGVSQAEALAADSHTINDQGGVEALGNPEFTKRGAQLLSAANVMRKLTAQPEEAASTPEPVPQVIGPIAKKMLQEKLKQGLPPEPTPTPSDAPASPAIGALMGQLRAKQAAMAPAAAPPPASAVPASMPAPAQPLTPELPQTPLIAKITKKLAEGPVKETPHPEEDQPYAPKEDLWRKGLSDQAVADKALSQYEPEQRTKYSKTIIENREGHRSALEAIAHENEPDGAAVEALYHDLDHVSSQSEASKSINHFTNFMTPKASKAVRDHYTNKMIAKRWKN